MLAVIHNTLDRYYSIYSVWLIAYLIAYRTSFATSILCWLHPRVQCPSSPPRESPFRAMGSKHWPTEGLQRYTLQLHACVYTIHTCSVLPWFILYYHVLLNPSFLHCEALPKPHLSRNGGRHWPPIQPVNHGLGLTKPNYIMLQTQYKYT